MDWNDIEQVRHYNRNKMALWRGNNPERNKINAKKARQNRSKWLGGLIAERKANGCLDCKQQFPFYVLEFDHTRGKRECVITSQIAFRSKQFILEEMAKCDVVCANCHRVRTWLRGQQRRGPTKPCQQ